MATVSRLYRFPVKGLTPAPVERVSLRADGAIEGDRVLGFLLADAGEEQRAGWWPKASFLTMQNTPDLALVSAAYDGATHVLSLSHAGAEFASGDVQVDMDRLRLAEALGALVATFDENPLVGHPERLPLNLVGDGSTPRFHDRTAHNVTLMGSASIAALEATIGGDVDERRFRMNVTIDGLDAWEDLSWIGGAVRIGDLDFDVTGPIVRCLATHANPVTGERDLDVMQTLTREFDQERPTMGVLAVPRTAGAIAVGDEVTLIYYRDSNEPVGTMRK